MSDLQSPSSRGNGGPLGIGNIISRAFGLVNRNYLALFLLNLPVLLAPIVMYGPRYYELISPLSAFDKSPERLVAIHQMFGGRMTMFAGNIVTFVVWAICNCGAVRLLNDSFDQRGRPAISSVKAGAKRIPMSLLVLLIAGVVYLIALLIVGGIGALTARAGSLLAGVFLGSAVFILLACLAFPYIFALYACIIDETGAFASYRRSRSLTAFYRWPLFSLSLATIVIILLMTLAYVFVVRIFGGLANGQVLILVAVGIFPPYYMGFATSVFVVAYSRMKFLKNGSGRDSAVASVFE